MKKLRYIDCKRLTINLTEKGSNNMGFKPSEYEDLSLLVPVAVNYRCEICCLGHVVADPNEPMILELSNPPKMKLRRHICDRCGGELMLPKSYPYIEWMSKSEYTELSSEYNIKEE